MGHICSWIFYDRATGLERVYAIPCLKFETWGTQLLSNSEVGHLLLSRHRDRAAPRLIRTAGHGQQRGFARVHPVCGGLAYAVGVIDQRSHRIQITARKRDPAGPRSGVRFIHIAGQGQRGGRTVFPVRGGDAAGAGLPAPRHIHIAARYRDPASCIFVVYHAGGNGQRGGRAVIDPVNASLEVRVRVRSTCLRVLIPA